MFIDVFPLDSIASSNTKNKKIRQKIQRLFKLKIIKDVTIRNRKTITKKLALYILKILTICISYKTILNKIDSQTTEANRLGGKFVTDYNDFNNERIKLNKDLFNSLELYQFENREFYAFRNSDEVLRMLYGDYMTLPPLEQQVTHHGYVAYLKK